MLKTNKVYSWEEIVREYPDLYVFITDIKEKDGEIKTCKLLDVCKFEDKHNLVEQYVKSGKKFRCCRTTTKLPNMGIIL